MMKPGSDVLFQEPTSEIRLLRRSSVVEASKDGFSVRFESNPMELEAGQEILMYFNGKSEFMQQVARILEVEVEGEEGPLFSLEPIGDPISAENRENYRVSTISANIAAKVGAEADLSVQDLSATGFAVLAAEPYQIGQTLDVAVAYGDEACHGTASVQSIRELESGQIRYGLRALADDPHTDEFLEVMQRISLAVQREQLQRSGGASS